jgi:hypothetical protein
MLQYIHTDTHTHVHTLHTYIRHIHTYVTYIHTHIRTYIHTYVQAIPQATVMFTHLTICTFILVSTLEHARNLGDGARRE